ncbi:MAG: FMN-binding negative transcriptional regulator [Ferrimicrobium sp.]
MSPAKIFYHTDSNLIATLVGDVVIGELITSGSMGPMASQIPLLLREDSNGLRICGHLARSNPQWRETADGSIALAVIRGPDTYISPGWYPSKTIDGKVVPTWNYRRVEARGSITIIHDHDWLYTLVTDLTNHLEARQMRPWKVTDAPSEFIDAQIRAIVGFEITITEFIGIDKLSQNRSAADQNAVLAVLEAGNEVQRAVAEAMRSTSRSS